MTHDEVSIFGLRWLLTRGWCSCAATEISYAAGRLDAVGVSVDHAHEVFQHRHEWQHHLDSVMEARRNGDKTKRVKRAAGAPKSAAKPQLGIVEAKATRSDLLSDLRQRKMHSYGVLASHAWLIVTREALLLDERANIPDMREAFDKLDVPKKWGLLVVPRTGRDPISVRRARKLRDVSSEECAAWRVRIGRSLSWRALSEAEK